MAKLIPFRKKQTAEKTSEVSPKMQAFLDMQEMRKKAVQYDFSEIKRETAN